MESYEKLKKILCTEIEDTVDSVMKQGQMSMGDLEAIDKLTHSLKSLITTMAMEEGGYSYNSGYSGARRRDSMGRYMDGGNSGRYYDDGGYSGRRYYDGGYSGRRSRDEGKTQITRHIETMMEDANQEEREVLQSALNKLKNM